MLTALLGGSGSSARAGFVIQERFAIGPNGLDSSPGFAGWVPNAIQGITNGFQTVGNFATDPTAFQTITAFKIADLIPTSDFNSWRGSAFPSGAFANELGNLLYSPVDIKDVGGQFSLSQVVFTGLSSDNPSPGNPGASLLGNVTDLANFSYNAGRIGLIHHSDGTVTYITSGASSQLVDEIIYRGVGSFDTDLTLAGSGMTGQQLLNAEIAKFAAVPNLSFTGTYTIYKDGTSRDAGSILFSNSATIGTVPEPSSLAMMTIALLGSAAAARFRRRKAV